jgi:CysZ protein
MMRPLFDSIGLALRSLRDPALLGVMGKALLLTLLLFAAALALMEWGIAVLPLPAWAGRLLEVLAPVLGLLLLGLAGAPVTALFASLFLDGLAAGIERHNYPNRKSAMGGTYWVSLKAGLRLTAAILVADVALLPLDFGLPGIGEGVGLLVNGCLLGWEYFELAALRHHSQSESDALRRRGRGAVWGGGVAIALLSAVPIAGLFAPLFGTLLMVHLVAKIEGESS